MEVSARLYRVLSLFELKFEKVAIAKLPQTDPNVVKLALRASVALGLLLALKLLFSALLTGLMVVVVVYAAFRFFAIKNNYQGTVPGCSAVAQALEWAAQHIDDAQIGRVPSEGAALAAAAAAAAGFAGHASGSNADIAAGSARISPREYSEGSTKPAWGEPVDRTY